MSCISVRPSKQDCGTAAVLLFIEKEIVSVFMRD
jgi:hypothetical protein